MAFLFIILGTLMWSIDTLIRYPLLGQVSASTIVLLEHSFLVIYFIPFLFMTKFNLKRLSKNHLLAFAVIGLRRARAPRRDEHVPGGQGVWRRRRSHCHVVVTRGSRGGDAQVSERRRIG